MWQAVLLVVLLGYGAVLCMTAVTLLLSAVFKNSYGVIITDFLLVLIPSFLYETQGDTSGSMFWHCCRLK